MRSKDGREVRNILSEQSDNAHRRLRAPAGTYVERRIH